MRYMLTGLAIWHCINGLWMLAAPLSWYNSLPGVTESGPANLHFIRDIGLAFLAGSFGLLAASLNSSNRMALWASMVFLAGHSAMHILDLAEHATSATTLRDMALIVLPGILPVAALFRWQR